MADDWKGVMQPKNLLFIMSDEHNPKFLGCAGHPLVKTPNLDRLAASGTYFTNAYSNGPICVPSRASFATGRYTHDIGYWDNAHPYDGRVPGWGHRLQETGHKVVSIGKLHYRNASDPTGFDRQIIPMHVVDGVGDVLGSVRDPLPVRHRSKSLAEKLGPGETSYTKYDRDIVEETKNWLAEAAEDRDEQPWVLFVSLLCPHFPLVAPEQFFKLYEPADMPLPKQCRPEEREDHPWIDANRNCFTHDLYFDDEKRRLAIASYMGLCSFTDDNVGKVLSALDQSGLADETRVIYVSDHGDNLGARGLWGKSNLFEESAGVPLILSGPDVPVAKICRTPVSLVDGYPSIMDAVGEDFGDGKLPGRSWFSIAAEPYDSDRTVLSEYHAVGAATGAFMLRQGRYKYCYYVGMAPQLFDLENDPEELSDLASNDGMRDQIKHFEIMLRELVDPEAVDARAKRDQAALVDRHGGREAVIGKGSFGATPVPGDRAQFDAGSG